MINRENSLAAKLSCLGLVLVVFVLMSFLLWEQNIAAFSGRLFNELTTPIVIAVVLIVLLSFDCLLPTPSSLVSAAAALYFGLSTGALVIFIGMTLGVVIGYLVGAKAATIPYIDSLFREEEIRIVNEYSSKYGLLSLSIARPIPVLAEVSVMMAGLSRVPFKRVFLFTLPANLLISITYAFLGLIKL